MNNLASLHFCDMRQTDEPSEVCRHYRHEENVRPNTSNGFLTMFLGAE
jgi:hypothetical protein